jgi:hypothetical protein
MKILAFALAGMLTAAGARAQTYSYVVTAPFGGYVVGQLLSGSVGDTLVAEGWGAYLLRTGSGGSDTPIPPPPNNQIQIIAASGTGQSDGIPLRAVRTIITGTVSTAAGTLQPGFNQTIQVVNQCSIPFPVYPALGGTINGQAVNLPVAIPVGATATFSSTDGVAWIAP